MDEVDSERLDGLCEFAFGDIETGCEIVIIPDGLAVDDAGCFTDFEACSSG